jgi:ketosteroid isomerase-like protein
MSQENVERLQRFYEAFNSGSGMEPLLELADPNFVYRTRPEFPDGGVYDVAGALERMRALNETFDDIRWEPQEFIDSGDRILVVVRQTGRGHTSGAPVDQPIVHVWGVGGDGAVTELAVYSSRSEALEAAGLEG